MPDFLIVGKTEGSSLAAVPTVLHRSCRNPGPGLLGLCASRVTVLLCGMDDVEFRFPPLAIRKVLNQGVQSWEQSDHEHADNLSGILKMPIGEKFL